MLKTVIVIFHDFSCFILKYNYFIKFKKHDRIINNGKIQLIEYATIHLPEIKMFCCVPTYFVSFF